MKIYIVQDQEGVSGVVEGEGKLKRENPIRARETSLLMTHEINAAVEGALEAGAKEIVVHESHKFILEELHSDIKLLMGSRKSMVDESYDALFIVGQHSRARTPNGVLCHTYCSSAVREMFLNGMPIGEIGFTAAFAGYHGVPTALVTGDRAAAAEARELLGDIEVAAVKEGLGLNSALCLSPRDACNLIREKAHRATERIKEFKPYRVSSPVELKVEYFSPLVIERAEVYPGVRKLDCTTLALTADDLMDVYNFRRFLAMIHAI